MDTDLLGNTSQLASSWGTPAYMAPEMLTSSTGASWSSDIFAAGCIMYELCTLRRPFWGRDLEKPQIINNVRLHWPPQDTCACMLLCIR